MLGKRSSDDESEHPYLDHVGRDSFYGFLACHREELFCDEDFADLYCPDNGRPSVPPSLSGDGAALASLRRGFRRRGQGAGGLRPALESRAGVGLEERPFAKSTLQLFRARLIIHERVRTIFRKSLDFARHTGYLAEPQAQGRSGHHLHPGPGSGKGHLQPAGRRDRQAGAGIGRRSHAPTRRSGRGSMAWGATSARL